MTQNNKAAISVRVDDILYKECKKKLVDDDKTIADLIRSALKQYVNGDLTIK